MFENVNETAILVSAILAVAVGSIWYSPLLFGNRHVKTIGHTADDSPMANGSMVHIVIKGVIAQALFFYAAAQCIVLFADSKTSSFHMCVLLSMLFFAQMLSISIWERRPFTHVLVNTGYVVMILFGGFAVISLWPW